MPGTALTSYINIGAVPETTVANDMRQVSESFFNSDFTYKADILVRDGAISNGDATFDATKSHRYLCFDGIDWRATVELNGKRVGRIDGAPAYSSTKRFQSHYLECLTQQARMRHLPISITDIRPGFVRTALIDGSDYPLQLDAKRVAHDIVKAMERGKAVKVIDWRYAILVFFWRLVPRWLWTRMMIAR